MTPDVPSHDVNYRTLSRKPRPRTPPLRCAESELDTLFALKEQREKRQAERAQRVEPDPIEQLRALVISDLIPVFAELVDKYAPKGVSMRMDASKLLAGGREITLDFVVGDDRARLEGTVTNDAIAFQATHYVADSRGELTSGPMLRLRQLTRTTFREFVCGRLAALIRTSLRRQ
ncbi:MAG: hypothetical protein ACE5E6_06040 [Phycisphaerae bacterium]